MKLRIYTGDNDISKFSGIFQYNHLILSKIFRENVRNYKKNTEELS